jgi:pimeloyl-ACP methyl ester carboxylesterase
VSVSRRLALAAACLSPLVAASARAESGGAGGKNPTIYKSVAVDGVNVFYREAGPPDAPVILLMHGFPSSSRMYAGLIAQLSDRFRLIAPDYPGFGHSDAPPPEAYAYTFAHLAETMDGFTRALGLDRYALYVADYGGPVGYRLAVAHPERVTALVIQNAVAHPEGISGPLWEPRKAFWADRAGSEAKVRENLISPAAARLRHVGLSPHPERYDPDLWTDEAAFLARPGQDQIQLELFYDYRTNVAAYPVWQAWLRDRKPRTLVAWGRWDPSFNIAEVDAIRRTHPGAEIHVLDAGHFALDEATDEIAALIRTFLT